MQRIADLFRQRPSEDFSQGDHREYVEPGARDIFLIGGAAVVLVAAFVVSLV